MAAVQPSNPWDLELFTLPGEEGSGTTSPHTHASMVIDRYSQSSPSSYPEVSARVDGVQKEYFQTQYRSEQAAARALVREAVAETHFESCVVSECKAFAQGAASGAMDGFRSVLDSAVDAGRFIGRGVSKMARIHALSTDLRNEGILDPSSSKIQKLEEELSEETAYFREMGTALLRGAKTATGVAKETFRLLSLSQAMRGDEFPCPTDRQLTEAVIAFQNEMENHEELRYLVQHASLEERAHFIFRTATELVTPGATLKGIKVGGAPLVASRDFRKLARHEFIGKYQKPGLANALVRQLYQGRVYTQFSKNKRVVWLTDQIVTKKVGTELAAGAYYHQTSLKNALSMAGSGKLLPFEATKGKGVWLSLVPETEHYGEIGIVLRRSAIDASELSTVHPKVNFWKAVKNPIEMAPENVVAVTFERTVSFSRKELLTKLFAERGIPVISAEKMNAVRERVVQTFGFPKPRHWAKEEWHKKPTS